MDVTPRGDAWVARSFRALVEALSRNELPATPNLESTTLAETAPGQVRNGRMPLPALGTSAPPGTLRSCLYECSVMHHRLEPKEHQFRYRIFLFALDLDELDAVAARVAGFSRNRWNFYAFRDDDHLKVAGKEAIPLRDKLTAWLDEQGVTLPAGARITLVTLPRVLGYIFNPVSFYFCADASAAPLCAVVEVSNTFHEMKLYLLREPIDSNRFRLVTPKHFYVSPFAALDLAFDFKLRVPDETLEIHIDDRAGDRRVLLSALTGRRTPLTSARLWWFTLKYPLITLRVIALIHWHALRLWLRRVPWHRKAADPDLQRDVLHPHASLTQKSP